MGNVYLHHPSFLLRLRDYLEKGGRKDVGARASGHAMAIPFMNS